MSTPKMYSSFIPNGQASPHLCSPAHQALADAELSLSQVARFRRRGRRGPCLALTSVWSLSQADGELSGLPTPDSTPELPIKNMKALRHHQYEKNHNCNNAKDGSAGCSGSGLSFMAVVGSPLSQQTFALPHHHSNGTSSTSLHLPEEKKLLSDERATQQPLPQPVVDVSALDELLKHIHEVSASGTGGIKVLTSTSSLFPSSASGRHHHSQTRTHQYSHSHHHSNQHHHQQQQQIPETEPALYYSTSTLPREGPKLLDPPPQTSTSSSCSSSSSSSNNPTSSTSIPSSSSSSSSTPLQQQVILERPGASGISVARHHSQRQSLIKMGSGGGAVPRHHAFAQRGPQQAHFLARMNTNSSSNGPPAPSRQPPAASTCLTRQHSYSEGPHVPRAAVVRRTVSLKPQVPPKPLFLPNTAAAPGPEAKEY